MMRPFSDELFPAEAGYEGPRTQDVFQGGENSCTTMGVLNAVESLVHADEEGRGVPVADCLQLSYAFLWRLLKKQSRINVETAVTALGQFGTCLERLYPYATEPNYPYRVTTLDQDPSALAWADAANRKIKLDIETVSGKFEMARAIATGSRLITTRVGGNLEHIEAGIKYHQDRGIRIHGSGGRRFWEPWESFEPGGVMSKVWAIRFCSIAPLHQHREYRAPTPASFADGVLTIPYLTLMPKPENWQEPPQYFKNVRVHFGSDIGPDNVSWDDATVSHFDCRWKPASEAYGTPHLLSLFAVNVDGLIFRKVTVKGVIPTIVSYEKD